MPRAHDRSGAIDENSVDLIDGPVQASSQLRAGEGRPAVNAERVAFPRC